MTNLLHLTTDLGQRIKAAREAAGLPQQVAAKRLRVSLRTLQAWEAGSSFPQLRHRQRLSAFLDKHEQENVAR